MEIEEEKITNVLSERQQESVRKVVDDLKQASVALKNDEEITSSNEVGLVGIGGTVMQQNVIPLIRAINSILDRLVIRSPGHYISKLKNRQTGNANRTKISVKKNSKLNVVDELVNPIGSIQTLDSDNCYQMTGVPRGLSVVINNAIFDGLSERKGSEKDNKMLIDLFNDLGFDVKPYENKTVKEMFTIMEEIKKMMIDKDYKCLFVTILSHGDEGVIYGTDGTAKIEDLLQPFKGFVGIPKVFVIQACQGNKAMPTAMVKTNTTHDSAPALDTKKEYIPMGADFYVAYSTVPGHISNRNEIEGTWFIQALIKVFRDNSHKMNVKTMFTRIRRAVSQKVSSHGFFQCTRCDSTFRKDLYLMPPNGPLNQADEHLVREFGDSTT